MSKERLFEPPSHSDGDSYKKEIDPRRVFNFKVREESEGAFLFRLQDGSATRLAANEYALLKDIYLAENLFRPSIPERIKEYFPDDTERAQRWLDALQEEGFFSPDGSINARFIFPSIALSKECLAAPSRIYLELTRACNLRCKTCLNTSGAPLEGELTLPEIYNILEELERIGTFEVRFTGGEPTVHPHFFEIVDYARSLGLYISLATNGVYSNEFREKLLKAGIDWFRVSLDGPEEVNDYIRGRGSFQSAIETIKAISERTTSRLTVSIVLGRYNVKHFPSFVELLAPYRIESISTLPLRLSGRAAQLLTDQMLTREEWYTLALEVQELRKKFGVKIKLDYDVINPERQISELDRLVEMKHSCAAGIEGGCISPTGDFYACGYSPASDPTIDEETRRPFLAGNVRKNSIIELWQDSSRWALFRHLEKSKEGCQACSHYGSRCFGACPVTVYYMHKSDRFDGRDPYCLAPLKGKNEQSRAIVSNPRTWD